MKILSDTSNGYIICRRIDLDVLVEVLRHGFRFSELRSFIKRVVTCSSEEFDVAGKPLYKWLLLSSQVVKPKWPVPT